MKEAAKPPSVRLIFVKSSAVKDVVWNATEVSVSSIVLWATVSCNVRIRCCAFNRATLHPIRAAFLKYNAIFVQFVASVLIKLS